MPPLGQEETAGLQQSSSSQNPNPDEFLWSSSKAWLSQNQEGAARDEEKAEEKSDKKAEEKSDEKEEKPDEKAQEKSDEKAAEAKEGGSHEGHGGESGGSGHPKSSSRQTGAISGAGPTGQAGPGQLPDDQLLRSV